MRQIVPAVLAAALLLCSPPLASAQTPAPPSATSPNTLACDGPLKASTSHSALVKAYGAGNVTTEEVDGAEGETDKVTVLFAKDPARRLVIYWDNPERTKLSSARVSSPGWAGPLGLRTGLPLEDVARINGAPLTIFGFEWDMGGYATDLKGKLAKLPGGCSVMLRFNPGIDLPDTAKYKAVIGEKKIRSDNALLLSVKPHLAEWSISYGD